MKKLFLLLSTVFLFSALPLLAKPRYPFPTTPDQVGQNDRDLDDANRTLSQTVTTISSGVVVSTSGIVTKPLQPSFLVTNSTGPTNFTGDGTSYVLQWPTEVYDQANNFSGSTFTAPVTGRYLLTVSIMIDNLSVNHTGRQLRLVTTNRNYLSEEDQSAGVATAYTNKSYSFCVIADMTAGNTAVVTLVFSGSTKTLTLEPSAVYNYFSGSLIN